MFVNDAAQNLRLLMAQLGLVGVGAGPARFQVRGNEREGEICRNLDVHLGETAADVKTAAIQQEAVIRVRMPRDDGQLAQNGDMDVRVPALNVFPAWIIQSFGLERSAEFEQRVGAAHFFEREHVRIQRADALADFGARLNGFDLRTRFGWLVQIIFDVVGGNAKCFGGKGNRTKQRERQAGERKQKSFEHGLV